MVVVVVFLVVMPVVLMTLRAGPGQEVWILKGSLQLPRPLQTGVRLLAGIGYMTVAVAAALVVITVAALTIGHPMPFPSWFSPPPT